MSAFPPFAEDLVLGVELDRAPDITIDEGMASQYLAISGDQLRPTLSSVLSRALTGRRERLANPNLVIGLSIGQSTVATGRVVANLRYDNLTLHRQLHVGETVRTTVTPLAAAWTRSGTDRAKVLLGMAVTTAHGESVAHYQRLALLPVSEPTKLVAGELPPPVEDLPLTSFRDVIPRDWTHPSSHPPRDLVAGKVWADPLADTVSSARELVRLTQNQAATHRDARAGLAGKRLVYGGHTVALAGASLSRFTPDLLTVLAWRSCDHLAPVFEDDLLTFEVTVTSIQSVGQFRLADATVRATVHRDGSEPIAVLDWCPVLLLTGGHE